MKSIKEKAEEFYPGHCNAYTDARNEDKRIGFEAGANYVLGEIEKELQRRMLEDYSQGAEEDEVAQGCMASMMMFVRQLKG